MNFNPRFLEDPPDSWAQTLAAAISSGIDPSRFVFEVIESDEIKDLTRLLDILDSCREAGCRVALDDLGTGYNSLQLMSHVRPDFVKLDMELIRDVDRDAYKSCVAGKILELARELDVYTVVEGVETQGRVGMVAGAWRRFRPGLSVRPSSRRSTIAVGRLVE